MISRVRVPARAALLATTLAVLGFGAAGYGMFGAVPVTRAILETTSQAPADIAPRPSPGVVPTGAASATRPPYDATPLIAVLVLGAAGATVLVRLRRARQSRADSA